jgi:hypothetical protein
VKIQISYRVPVSAILDLDEERLDGVVIWPTALQRLAGEPDFVVVGIQMPATQEQRRQARRIADSQEWPAWHSA